MCDAILVKRRNCHVSDSIPDPVTAKQTEAQAKKSVKTKSLQPYNSKTPIGSFTAKSTSPELILDKHSKLDAQKYLIAQVGLENFIHSISQVLDLKLPDNVKFNMNGQGIFQSWEDVYMGERVYTRCLGISKRIYQTHAYTHETERSFAYFILEEHNERSHWLLPGFDFYVLVFTHYDVHKNVTKVDVQYDQMSFYLHCLGLAQAHAWLVGKVTPIILVWAKFFYATGLVNPLTFLLNLLAPILAFWYYYG